MTDTVELGTNFTAYTEEVEELLISQDVPLEFIPDMFKSSDSFTTGSIKVLDRYHWAKGLIKRENGETLFVFHPTQHFSLPTFHVVINPEDNLREIKRISKGEPKNVPNLIGEFEKGPNNVWQIKQSLDQNPNDQQL